jgi:predicted restriction endonuclease
MSSCLYCNSFTKNKKFCSRSCAASHNNKSHVKRKPEGRCKNCSGIIKSSRTYCKLCFAEKHKIQDMTLKEAIYDRGHRASAYALVRTRARSTDKFKNTQSCQFCGYSKHIEACHVKSISSFPPTTLLSEINHESNIIALCRNCHWEYDHGLIRPTT